MSKYVAAVVQAGSYPDDPLKSTSKAAGLIREAASRGARLAVFPEAFIGGYPKGASFGAPVGLRKPEGREVFRVYCEAAIDLDGEAVKTIAAATSETGMFAVIGCIERDGGTLRGAVLRRREWLDRQAPQADADCRRAAALGFRGRIDHAGV